MPLPKQTTTFIVKVSKGFPGRNVSTMTIEIKAQALLASPVGCALLLDISHNSHLPLEYFADPMVSFWLLSCAVDWSDIRSELNARELALEHAQDHADLARRIVENPAFAWWYDPVDTETQVWVSPQFAGDRLLHPERMEPFDPESWRTPNSGWSTPGTWTQETSTLRGGTTSQVMAYAIYSADHIAGFPLPAWRVEFQQEMRVWEINHPSDWHRLCSQYPGRARDGRLIPDWKSVAIDWDGVHLSLGGVLSCEQARYEQGGEWSMMKWWHTEQTKWLRELDITGQRMVDFQREPHEVNLPRYPYRGAQLY